MNLFSPFDFFSEIGSCICQNCSFFAVTQEIFSRNIIDPLDDVHLYRLMMTFFIPILDDFRLHQPYDGAFIPHP
ncbi:hypothetical protein [Mesobacillus foraminis]|uniref:hypothetical protein n=1 Tax=Mesobacillus foraminis TaxID=279826 RepID=UPI0013CE3F0A|nr:hypothetical protein [Mesobacillus foraminis]